MKFQLNENWQVTTDPYQFQLKNKRIIKDKNSKNFGGVMWDVVGYYPTLDLLIKGCLKQEILKSDFDDLVDLEAHLSFLSDVFIDAIPNLKIISKRLEVS